MLPSLLTTSLQAQMPSYIDYEELRGANAQCPFFSFCSLQDVVDASSASNSSPPDDLSEEEAAAGGTDREALVQIVSVAVDGSTISRYR